VSAPSAPRSAPVAAARPQPPAPRGDRGAADTAAAAVRRRRVWGRGPWAAGLRRRCGSPGRAGQGLSNRMQSALLRLVASYCTDRNKALWHPSRAMCLLHGLIACCVCCTVQLERGGGVYEAAEAEHGRAGRGPAGPAACAGRSLRRRGPCGGVAARVGGAPWRRLHPYTGSAAPWRRRYTAPLHGQASRCVARAGCAAGLGPGRRAACTVPTPAAARVLRCAG
jgi:hypothetical protein